MTYICVICTLRKPPLTPLTTEHRQLLEAIVSPTITMADLTACEIMLCTECQEKLQSIQQFQKMAVDGLTILKSVLSKVNNATVQDHKIKTLIQMGDGRELLVNPISVVETVITEPEMEESSSSQFSVSSARHSNENKYKPEKLKQAQIAPKQPKAAKVGIIARAFAAKQAKAALKTSASAVKEVNVASEEAHDTIEANVASEEAHAEVNIASESSDDEDKEVNLACATEEANGAEKANDTNITTEANVSAEKEKKRESKKPERVQCSLCDKLLCHNRSLQQHFYLRHAEIDPVKCELCRKQFRNAGVLHYHQCPNKKATPKPAPTQYCQECSLHFPNPAQYKAHLLTLKHTPRDLYKFECEVCKKRFRHKHWMRDHVDWIHRGLKKYSCDKCDSSFGAFTSLRRHVARAHDKVAAPRATHVCDLCGKTFKVKKSLEEHLLTHYGLRPFGCASCPATFSYRAALYTHTRLKHRGNKKGKKEQEDDEQMDDSEAPQYLEFTFDD
ncbi:zinc finger Y-chromosomal protein 2-like isoform X2 [Cydia strobilella]|uniref:zinc finger Y-chromosomal protein 2-like isoform X2 n=1 Tax=Cydia strobilella TaxID=1100964 RepID=UPI0030066C1B